MEKQRTISNAVQIEGIGLHTGNLTRLTFKPAEANTGIRFIRTDLKPAVIIPAEVDYVVDTVRGTTLGLGKVRIQTVEHVLAAIVGLGLDNLIIELDNNEPPVMDGSSLPFVDVLCQVGIEEQTAIKRYVTIEEPIWLSGNKDTHLVVLPDDEFKITYTVDYGHPLLRSQYGSFLINQETFQREIAPARTFCFLSEVEELQKQGLIKGGSLDNAVVIADDKIMNEPLRFDDEFVRHKILDLMGDLYLLGYPLKGHLVVTRSGHTFNVALVRKLKEYLTQKTKQTRLVTGKVKEEPQAIIQIPPPAINEYPLESDQIQKIIPHRYPFLLVDRILEMDQKRAVGIKNVSINEPFFQGHFPGHPIMPGVLIIEAMAQVAGVYMLSREKFQGRLAYFLAMDEVKFRKPVLPGDQLRLEIEILKFRGKIGKAQGNAIVDGNVVAEAIMTFALIEQ